MSRQLLKNNYPVLVSSGLNELKQKGLFDRGYSAVFLLADENTDRFCLPELVKTKFLPKFTKIVIPAGENYKNLDFCKFVYAELAKGGADRNSLLINLGGGVVCDLGGFVGATYKRGVDFVNIPTTLLAMVDASVGGKTGVNLDVVKNLVGVFKDPVKVIIWTGFLQTLPELELRSGFAEVLKHSLINGKRQYTMIRKKPDLSDLNWEKVIFDSICQKLRVVRNDFREKESRKILNLGHTFGHALESYSMRSETPLTHGESVAEGLIFEVYLCHLKYNYPKPQLDELISAIRKYFPKKQNLMFEKERIYDLMLHDKKNNSGNISFSLLKQAGVPAIDSFCERNEIDKAFKFWLKN